MKKCGLDPATGIITLTNAERRILEAMRQSKRTRGRLPTTKELAFDAKVGRAHLVRCFPRLVEYGYLQRTVQTVLVDLVQPTETHNEHGTIDQRACAA